MHPAATLEPTARNRLTVSHTCTHMQAHMHTHMHTHNTHTHTRVHTWQKEMSIPRKSPGTASRPDTHLKTAVQDSKSSGRQWNSALHGFGEMLHGHPLGGVGSSRVTVIRQCHPENTDGHLSKEPWLSIASYSAWRVCGLRGPGTSLLWVAELWDCKNP